MKMKLKIYLAKKNPGPGTYDQPQTIDKDG